MCSLNNLELLAHSTQVTVARNYTVELEQMTVLFMEHRYKFLVEQEQMFELFANSLTQYS